MDKNNINIVKNLLTDKQKITIVSHRNPDGDAMGSALGLGLFLKKLGHQINVIMPNNFPDFLAWLPHTDTISIFEEDTEATKEILDQASLVFTVDFNALHRTGKLMEEALKELDKPFLMIDHHLSPDDYAAYMFSDTKYGSTCEMIYHFIAELGYENLIDAEIATCLYTGIVTDSGSFKYPTTSSLTHKVVSSLIAKGIDNAQIHNLLFDNNSYDRLKLLGRGLENMVVLPELQTAYITLSEADLKEFDTRKGDTEGIVNYPLTIKGIVFSVIFIENLDEGIIKMSLRSQGNFDVNVFARTYFNGGGHKNAAGGRSDLNLDLTVKHFLDVLSKDNPNSI
ncbi:MAG TPA: bifunctional oligoribonuclease/PAP phosphatase NrnA [Flavobacterium sp.]|nr:bifunctional oligoribonuclease/PAP phosphatase NrnA [Flavobacterium sp.]